MEDSLESLTEIWTVLVLQRIHPSYIQPRVDHGAADAYHRKISEAFRGRINLANVVNI